MQSRYTYFKYNTTGDVTVASFVYHLDVYTVSDRKCSRTDISYLP